MAYPRALASFQQVRQVMAQRYVTQGQEYLQRDDAKRPLPTYAGSVPSPPGTMPPARS